MLFRSVDVEQIDPISRFGREQVMRMDMEAERISFEEFVEALPDDAVTPKGAYKEMLDRRAMQAQMMPQGQMIAQGQSMQGMGIVGVPRREKIRSLLFADAGA